MLIWLRVTVFAPTPLLILIHHASDPEDACIRQFLEVRTAAATEPFDVTLQLLQLGLTLFHLL